MKKLFSLLPMLCLCVLALDIGAGAAYGELPSWYPADKESFVFFHDETAPRVVDNADLFTGAEEARMETRLAEIRAELNRDIVIYTDVSSYGMERRVLAADFYDYNGYGCGDEREGVCLFICMEEGNRGWWACCSGPETKALYTSDNANALDDALYGYMSAGDYAAGVADWIENVRTLFVKGIPFAPEWYPDLNLGYELSHNAEAARVVDSAGLLSTSEIAALKEQAAALSAKYGADVVIHTTDSLYGMEWYDYADRFYRYNGYGLGRDYDGILLMVLRYPGYAPDCRVYGFGKCVASLEKGVNASRLRSRCADRLDEGEYYTAMREWIDQTEHMFKTGRVPRSTGSWTLSAVLSALLGSAFGGISLGGAKRKMRTPQVQHSAGAYLAANGTRIVPVRDDFIGTRSTRRYAPPPKESSSSPSSGPSSFSSSYSGSSGSSHSGSGRDF